MDLYIIRHAIAVDPDLPGYEDDSQRPLTERGSKKMMGIARGLKALDIHFDLLLSSPYLRALDTAKILARLLAIKENEIAVSQNLVPMGLADDVIGEINEKYNGYESIALVGHEPNLSAVISLLIGGDAALAINMKKGGVCHLRAENLFQERRASLEWLLMPKHLIAIGDRD